MTDPLPRSDATEDAPIGFSPLEEALLGEDGRQVLMDRLAWIARTRGQVKDWLDMGVSPDEHSEGRALLDALDAAARILKAQPAGKGN